MKIFKQLLTLAATLPVLASAQNPIISTVFTPDPAPFVYGDKVYLFTDHDEDGRNRDFNMKDWMLFSTEDMVNWTYLGTQVSTATFKWARQGQRAWACQAVERNGKWYWYVCCNKATGGDALAVAVADDPQDPGPMPSAALWPKDSDSSTPLCLLTMTDAPICSGATRASGTAS